MRNSAESAGHGVGMAFWEEGQRLWCHTQPNMGCGICSTRGCSKAWRGRAAFLSPHSGVRPESLDYLQPPRTGVFANQASLDPERIPLRKCC